MDKNQCLLILGSQYGDEGKGKFVDLLSEKYDYIVRFQGGDNAGHSIVINNVKYKLRLIPSGIFLPNKFVVIGQGVNVNPKTLINEIHYLNENNFSIKGRLFISDRAHVIFDFHRAIDKYYEELKGKEKVGTTLCGIGPCYADKIQRVGVRMCDLLSKSNLTKKITLSFTTKKDILRKIGYSMNDIPKIVNEYYQLGQKIKPYIHDTITLLNNAYEKKKKILFEGAQGAFLDIDMGTYPYVTSSSVISGIGSGTGISINKITKVLGIIKAYTSRVGSGPFPTELTGPLAKKIRDAGCEYGTVTKRPRRVGWLDLNMLKFSCQVSGVTEIALTLIDVLTGIEKINVCVGYKYKNKILKTILSDELEYKKCKPVYKTFKGWKEDITKITNYNKLPLSCKKYIEFISKELKIPIKYVSVGNNRKQTIVR